MKPSYVVDCSIAMAWCFADESTEATAELLDRLVDEAALVPGWWYVEVTNVIALAEKHNRITADATAEFLALIESLEIEIDTEAPTRAFHYLLPLCRNHRLTSYDAIYLDLAVRRNLPLATLDESLRQAAEKVGVTLLGK